MTEPTAEKPLDTEKLARYMRNGAAIVHAASLGAREVTHLAGEIHGTISRLPSPLNRDHEADIRHAPFPYRIVAGVFDLVAKLTGALAPDTSEFQGELPLRVQAALNGVCGDKLARWKNPLAFPMSLRDADGTELDWQAWGQVPAQGHVLILHGLCYCEVDWQNPEASAFVDELKAQGYAVAWLRYNSGKAMHENGEELAAWLEDAFGTPGGPLVMIGHSMGGLMIRSACHHAGLENFRWPSRLRDAACLASPHLGAPLEQLGNAANSLLGITPYTKPLMRLGNIRSRGIKDLRHGWITHDHSMPPLPEHVRFLLLACALNSNHRDNAIGDGLVPVTSALAVRDGVEVLTGPKVEREFINDLPHIPVISDPRVFALLREWLGMPAGAAA